MKTTNEVVADVVEGGEDFPPNGLGHFVHWFREKLESIPLHLRYTASVRFRTYRDSTVGIIVSYDRPLTQVEIEADNRTAEQLAAHVEKCKRIARGMPPVAVDPLPYAKLAEHLRDILSAPPSYVAAPAGEKTVGYGDQE